MRDKKEQPVLSIWLVSREYDGIAGAGGVKDVCRQLAEALVDAGHDVRVVLPCYGFIDPQAHGFTPLQGLQNIQRQARVTASSSSFEVDMHYAGEERRETVSILQKNSKGVTLYLVESERYATKQGVYTYTLQEEETTPWQHQGSGHFDYFAMNILLQKSALDLMMLLQERPDIIHCQDGHAATLPAIAREVAGYRHYFSTTGMVVTVHNAGIGYHQEVGDLDFAQAITGLPPRVIHENLLDGFFDPFIAAADYAKLNTVSENYGRELQETPDDSRTGWLGHELLRRQVRLTGITNGINPADFDPAKDDLLGIGRSFNPRLGELAGKLACKKAMLQSVSTDSSWEQVEQFGCLEDSPDLPLLTFIGRLTAQKGVDVLLRALQVLHSQKAAFQFLVLGTGSPVFEKQLIEMTDVEAGRVCLLRGFDSHLATQIYAAGDFFLIPSLYEPCGLTDYIAQLFGNLPLVHHVGGLVKVIDGETGFAYEKHSPAVLARAMERALDVYENDSDKMKQMQADAVEKIYRQHTWQQVMQDYLDLYQQALDMSCEG